MADINNDIKPYQCTKCKNEEEHDTNHFGDIYPHCKVCGHQTVWVFTGEVPKGGWVPKKWATINNDKK